MIVEKGKNTQISAWTLALGLDVVAVSRRGARGHFSSFYYEILLACVEIPDDEKKEE